MALLPTPPRPFPPPRQYATEPSALDSSIALPVLSQRHTPAPPLASGTEARVCRDIAGRQALGIVKYGCTVEANPLTVRAWLEHGYHEALDLAIYLRRCMEQIDREREAADRPPAA